MSTLFNDSVKDTEFRKAVTVIELREDLKRLQLQIMHLRTSNQFALQELKHLVGFELTLIQPRQEVYDRIHRITTRDPKLDKYWFEILCPQLNSITPRKAWFVHKNQLQYLLILVNNLFVSSYPNPFLNIGRTLYELVQKTGNVYIYECFLFKNCDKK